MLRRQLRGAAAAAAVAATTTITMFGFSPAADAAPVTCPSGAHKCASVTAISSGSYLAFHNEPNYADGVIARSPHLRNGDRVFLDCWETGASDADGHGDRYWFFAGTGSGPAIGWINDWYVTTGSYAQWSPYIPHC